MNDEQVIEKFRNGLLKEQREGKEALWFISQVVPGAGRDAARGCYIWARGPHSAHSAAGVVGLRVPDSELMSYPVNYVVPPDKIGVLLTREQVDAIVDAVPKGVNGMQRLITIAGDGEFKTAEGVVAIVSGIKTVMIDNKPRLTGEAIMEPMDMTMLVCHLTQIIRNYCIATRSTPDDVMTDLNKIVNCQMESESFHLIPTTNDGSKP